MMNKALAITRIISKSQCLVSRNPNFRFNFIRSFSSRPGPLAQYKNLVEQGNLQHDPYQERVASELENLLGRLEQYEKDMEEYHASLASWERRREDEHRKLLMEEAEHKQQGDSMTTFKGKKNRLFENWIMRRKPWDVEEGVGKWVSYLKREKKLDSLVGPRPIAPAAPKGLYLYGNVGSGKL